VAADLAAVDRLIDLRSNEISGFYITGVATYVLNVRKLIQILFFIQCD
jgi:hypothetical protein